MCTYSLITPSPSHEREIAKESVRKKNIFFFGADSGKTWCKRVIQDVVITNYQVSGFHARLLQHEVDHLDGILYTDKMTLAEPWQREDPK